MPDQVYSTSWDGTLRQSYTYDANGNITSVSDGTYTTTYEYDNLNQLVRENNQKEGYTYVYTYSYDVLGNILNRKTYAYTTGTVGTELSRRVWSYGNETWADVLTGFTDAGSAYTITSDEIGNITSISNGTNSTTHTWLGRTLESSTVVKNGETTTITYDYDSTGKRTSKTVDGVTTHYYYNGDILAAMDNGTYVLTFMYDETGSPYGFLRNGTAPYYYVKNLQGDVVAITDSSGAIVMEYTYDAWGNVLPAEGTSSTCQYNPILYRGYVYDSETGYYYLQSRYYDPELCRFISADGLVSTGQGVLGYNMFSYCLNNPVCYKDETGLWVDIESDPYGHSVTIKITQRDMVGKATIAIVFDFAVFEEYEAFLQELKITVSQTNIDISTLNGPTLSFGYTASGLIPGSLTIPISESDEYELSFIASEDGFGLEITSQLSESMDLTIDMQYRHNFIVRAADRIISKFTPNISGLGVGAPRWQQTPQYANLMYASMSIGNTYGCFTYLKM